jgi:hypothetical protein
MTVTLINRSRLPKVIVLNHQTLKTPEYGHRTTVFVAHDLNEDGERVVRSVRRSLPGSLTLAPGEERSGLPHTVGQLEQVKRGISAGTLRIKPDPATVSTQAVPYRAKLDTSKTRTRKLDPSA